MSYIVTVVELDLPRYIGDEVPEVDGGWIEEFETLEEAKARVEQIRERSNWVDAKVDGHTDFMRYYTR